VRGMLAAALIAPLPALADGLTVCNDTIARATVALGYLDDGTWTSEGWWGIAPGACREIVAGPLSLSHYYLRPTSAEMSWDLPAFMFCTDDAAFTIVGDEDCAARGFRRERFDEIEIADGVTEFTYTLTGTSKPAMPQAFTDPNAPPRGTDGEPYTVSGLLSHCEVTDAHLQCEMHAPPWRYVASVRSDGDLGLLDRMMDMPPNTPVTWSGDMMGYGGRTAEVTVTTVRLEGEDRFAATRAALQGSWVSVDDANYRLIVSGGWFEEWYDGVITDARMIEIAETCEGALAPGTFLIAHALNEADPERCFSIDAAGPDGLELWAIGTMAPLIFVPVR